MEETPSIRKTREALDKHRERSALSRIARRVIGMYPTSIRSMNCDLTNWALVDALQEMFKEHVDTRDG